MYLTNKIDCFICKQTVSDNTIYTCPLKCTLQYCIKYHKTEQHKCMLCKVVGCHHIP